MIRAAERVLTGRPARFGEVVLGHREDGAPGATVHIYGLPSGSVAVCLADPAVVRLLREELEEVAKHLDGKRL